MWYFTKPICVSNLISVNGAKVSVTQSTKKHCDTEVKRVLINIKEVDPSELTLFGSPVSEDSAVSRMLSK